MSARLDAETKRLRALSPAQLADEAGAAKSQTEAIKAEAIRRGYSELKVSTGNHSSHFSQVPVRRCLAPQGMEPPTA